MSVSELLSDVLADPMAVLYGKSQAADSLVRSGPEAIDAIASVLREGPRARPNVKDVLEALGFVLGRLAVEHRNRVNDLLDDSSLAGNRALVQWALDYATQENSGG